MCKSLESLWSEIFITVYMYPIEPTSIPSTKAMEILLFNIHFQPPCDSLSWDVFCVPHETHLCLLHPASWPLRLTHMTHSGFPCPLAAIQVRGNTSRIWKMGSESEVLISIPASLLSGDGVIRSLNGRPEPLSIELAPFNCLLGF